MTSTSIHNLQETDRCYVDGEEEEPIRLEIAGILRRKASKTSNPRWRDLLNHMAYQLQHCRSSNPIDNFKESSCKSLMCPAYMATKYAVPATLEMQAHFESVHPLNLYFVRLTASPAKVKSRELASARRRLLYATVKLTQSRLWRRTFLSWGGAVHMKWTPASPKHGEAGFNLHVHLICEADDASEIDLISETWLHLIGNPDGPNTDPFYLEHVGEFDASMTYVPHLNSLLPGYKKKRGQRPLKRMPVRAIIAFLEASKGSHRLLRHGFNTIRVQAAKLKDKEEKALRRGRRG